MPTPSPVFFFFSWIIPLYLYFSFSTTSIAHDMYCV
jgi:hypothetical protein